jgi:hypothetical protein
MHERLCWQQKPVQRPTAFTVSHWTFLAQSLSDIAFVTRRKRRCDQMRGRRPGKTGGVFAGIHEGFFRAENDAAGCGSFAAVERSRSDRFLVLAYSSQSSLEQLGGLRRFEE